VDFIANGKEEEKNEVSMFRNGTGPAIPWVAMQAAQCQAGMSGNCQKLVNANLQLRSFLSPEALIVSRDSSARLSFAAKG
jgi:hypothetical protein